MLNNYYDHKNNFKYGSQMKCQLYTLSLDPAFFDQYIFLTYFFLLFLLILESKILHYSY